MNSPSPRPAPSPAPLPSARQAQTHFLLLFDPDSARADDWRRRLAPLDCPVLVANDWPAMLALAQQVPVAMQDPRILKSWIFTHGLAALISGGEGRPQAVHGQGT